jgi:hypothetical protein
MNAPQSIEQKSEREELLRSEKHWDEAARECREVGVDDTECVRAAQFFRRQVWLLDHKG